MFVLHNLSNILSFEIIRAVLGKIQVLWAMTQCRMVYRWQRFGGACYLHLQGSTRRMFLCFIGQSTRLLAALPILGSLPDSLFVDEGQFRIF